MKKIYLLALLMLCTIASYADISFTVDGINYSAVSSNAPSCKVTAGTYSGDIVIPEKVTYNDNEFTVTSIDNFAFYRLSELTSIELPSTISTMGLSAFSGCTSLKSINLPDNITVLNHYAFADCLDRG
jgi:glycosylphosphatidylinositol transamidase (GPIT) subunit GPI8